MSEILLTPDERTIAKDKGYKAFERDMQSQSLEQRIVDEYLKAQLKRVDEWGNEPCPHHAINRKYFRPKRVCTKCWQALQEACNEIPVC